MIEIEYYNRSADHFYTRTFENNLSAVPFLREFPSADTVLVKLDDRELFMNNSEIVSVLKNIGKPAKALKRVFDNEKQRKQLDDLLGI